MRTKFKLLLAIATLFFAAGIWAGCTVGFETSGDHQFPCAADDECIDGYECFMEEGADSGVCQLEGSEPDIESPPCDATEDGIDQDGDGFGVGTDRSECDAGRQAEDCDDTDPSVFPGAPELCDNKINDCEKREEANNAANEGDDFSCESSNDCGAAPGGRDMDFQCESGTCTMRPWNRPSGSTCADIYITCDSATQSFTYELNGTTYDFDEDDGPADDC